MSFPILVIGGGISGITAAVELAEAGEDVVLIEKEPYLGGNVSGFHNYFPKLCPPACGLEINYQRIRANPRISYYTGAEVKDISGKNGDFKANITLIPRLINNNCTSCGLCAEVCPEKRPEVLGRNPEERAAYIAGGLAFPMKYTIDHTVCQKEVCGKCLDVCVYDAIQLEAKASEIEIRLKKVIVATGWRIYDASRIENYAYATEADVVTNLEFEHVLAACARDQKKLSRPSDGVLPKRIAFIQCAGSRDRLHLPYCSAVCCSASLKHALTLASEYPDIRAEIFYIDMRLSGRNEKLLRRAQETSSIVLTKGKVGRVVRADPGGELVLEVEDIMAGSRRTDSFDMVVLATGLVPNPVDFHLHVNEYGFHKSIQLPGMIPAASCKRPMDVASSVRDATAASLKAMQE